MAIEGIPPEEGGHGTEELAYRLAQQRLTAEFGLFALRSRELDGLLHEASRVCAEGLHTGLCKVMEYLPQERQFVVRAGVGWRPGVVGVARVGADRESPTGFAFQTRAAVISNHLSAESRFRTPALLAEHGVKRAINVLVRGEDEPFGILEVDSPQEGRFGAADLAFLESMTSILGVAIEHHKAMTALQGALDMQRVLTQEIGHRVKNSLSIVASMLRIQQRGSTDPDITRALADAEARVRTVAEVHDHLWRNDEPGLVPLRGFFDRLCDGFRRMAPTHAIRCEVIDIAVSAERALFLGLVLNEVVTNAIKHAYPDDVGDVRVSLARVEPGHLRLEVGDRGIGMPPPTSGRPNSLGMRLLATMAQQLDGQITWQATSPGTRFVLEFPE